jgi:transcriptional antiterminator NusG
VQVIEEDSTYAWFVIKVRTQREQAAAKEIHLLDYTEEFKGKIKNVMIPTIVEEKSDNKTKPMVKKLFPGYLLIHMKNDPTLVGAIEKIPTVSKFLGIDPTSILTDEELKHIETLQKDKAYLQSKFGDSGSIFKVGQCVNIINGPFSDFKGIITEINYERRHCVVDVYILGRSTPVELNFEDIKQDE